MAERRPLVRSNGRVGQLPPGDTVPADTLPSNVSALAALIGAANKIAYFTGPGAMNLADFTVFARSWCALADAAAGRTLLGLGTAATRDATTSATDTTSERLWRTNDLVKTTSLTDVTVGSVLTTGYQGLGSIGIQISDVNGLDNILETMFFRVSNANSGIVNAPPGAGGGVGVTIVFGSVNIFQLYAHIISPSRVWFRRKTAGWTAWSELWHDGNFDPDLKANLLSPPLTGTPTTPTAAAGTNTTQIASTEFATSKTKVVTTRSGTSYTFVLADNVDVYNRFTNAGASTCTVPPNSSVAFPIGHVIVVRRAASANLTLTPGSGVTLNAPSGGTLVMTNNMTVELIKVATNTWDVVGQTVAA